MEELCVQDTAVFLSSLVRRRSQSTWTEANRSQVAIRVLNLIVVHARKHFSVGHSQPICLALAWVVIASAASSVLADIPDQLLSAASVADEGLAESILFGIDEGLSGTSARWRAAWQRHKPRLLAHASTRVQRQVWLLGARLADPDCVQRVRQDIADATLEASWRKRCIACAAAGTWPGLSELLLPLLDDPSVRLAAIQGLGHTKDERVPRALVRRLGDWSLPERRAAYQLLASRDQAALLLCEALLSSRLAVADVPIETVRQLRALASTDVQTQAVSLWGYAQQTPRQLQERIARYQDLLVASVLDQANLTAGQRLCEQLCLNCHRLHGRGGEIGPDLTGAQRYDLRYLLDNIVDPSREVGKNFVLAIVEVEDGRTLSGLVTEETPERIVLQTPTEAISIEPSQIAARRDSTQSMMPTGLLDALTDTQVRDLIGFLMAEYRGR